MEKIRKINRISESSLFLYLVELVKQVLSPTYLLAKVLKGNRPRRDKCEIIIFLNRLYFIISILLIFIVYLTPVLKIPSISSIIFYFVLSRINEVFFAFLSDAKDKMKYKTIDGDGLKYYQRISLALRSYLELILNYAILYWIFSYKFGCFGQYDKIHIKSILDAIYYSGTVITTLGFGDIVSQKNIVRLFSIYEIINGMMLIGVCFTVYVGLNFANTGQSKVEKHYNNKKLKNRRMLSIILISIVVILMINIFSHTFQ